MSADTGRIVYEQPTKPPTDLEGSFPDASMSPGSGSIRQRNASTRTPAIAGETRSKEKGKQRSGHLASLSVGETSTTTPTVDQNSKSDSYFLSIPPSVNDQDITPTSATMKAPPPPTRSPLRSSQPSPRRKPGEAPTLPAENPQSPQEESIPIPRQGRDDSEAARARRREAYKSGMSFTSLYELYSEPPPVPVPPLPPFDKAKLNAESGVVQRTRSGSTTSFGVNRERKQSAAENQGDSNVNNAHARSRSGSIGTPSVKGTNQRVSRDRSNSGAGIASSPPPGPQLGNSTISSTIPPIPITSNSTETVIPPTKSKRQHVLFEILETERIYSSDMALVKAVHLPLALGLMIDFGPMGSGMASQRSSAEQPSEPGPSRSSGVSTNTASSSQSQSGSSGYPVTSGYLTNEPPMSLDDAKVIFANIDELAEFTGRFTEFIQLALGSEIDGGEGPDKIGALFLEMLPIMAPIYETYITKHSASIARLTALTTENPAPAMINYIEHTKAIASTHSNSWDLNSLLIKPIQRFLKYPLLLETLLSSTPDTHPDKPALTRAKTAMVEASRLVNEQTQKVEICRTILQRKPLKGLSAVFATNTPTSQQLKVKGSKSVFSVTKSKDAPTNPSTPSPSVTPFDAAFDPIQLENRIVENASGGAVGLEELIKHLQAFETVLPRYLKDVVTWVRAVRDTLTRLEKWAASFERVISLEEGTSIEALDAFRGVLTERLSPILDNLETVIKTTLVPALAKIQNSMKGPTLLLNTAASLRTVHNQLMNTPYTGKNSKPSPQLVEGSKTYLALMQQLRTDLPVYVRHLDRMFGFVIMQVAKWQERWYREMGHAWGDLWNALEVGPGSRKEYRARRHKELSKRKKHREPSQTTDNGYEDARRGAYGCNGNETAAIWWDRWEEVNVAIAALGVPSGAALQGVRSLQNLIKNPKATFAAAPRYPSHTPGSGSSSSFQHQIIPETEEMEEEEEERYPPGYFPPSPVQSERKLRPSVRTNTSADSVKSPSLSSPTKAHSINHFLPVVSPGAERKDKGKGRPSPNGEPPHVTFQQPASNTSSREWGLNLSKKGRAQSQEREVRGKIYDQSGNVRAAGQDISKQGGSSQENVIPTSRTLPRGMSFRRRLTESMWFNEGSSKGTGLEVDGEELEAALATTHAREDREAHLASVGFKANGPPYNEQSRDRKISTDSSTRETLRKRKPSHTKDSDVMAARAQRNGSTSSISRLRPSVDLGRPRQPVSEYGRALAPTLESVGPAMLSDDSPILFTCTAVAPFEPQGLQYSGLPFLELEIGDIINIIKDAGRPSRHPLLKPVVLDGIDTLFIGKKLPDNGGSPELGWLWASFVMPIEM
ncbi:hypothetical protein CPB86DRAFT_222203 [Serendipita vermifera]|nr:hypothetical protein CPB86DRAFT_222203 [Serendipita vermifera]